MTGVFDTFPCGHSEITWMETPQIIHLPFVKSNARVLNAKAVTDSSDALDAEIRCSTGVQPLSDGFDTNSLLVGF